MIQHYFSIITTNSKQLFYALLTAVVCILSATTGNAQGFSFNTTGAAAAPSAMMDVSSTTRGVLLPRMTAAQKTAIASPATGLIIYQTDGTPGFYYFDGSAWTAIGGGGTLSGPAGGDLAGTYPNPTIAVTATAGNNIVSALGAATTGTIPAALLGSGSGTATVFLNGTGAFAAPITLTTTGTTGAATFSGGTLNIPQYTTGGSNWTLTGNTATTPGTNFVGTTDNNALVFKVNATEAGRLSPTGGTASYGYQSLAVNTGTGNTGMGYQALKSNTTGTHNTAIGDSSLIANTNANDNTAVGYMSLSANAGNMRNTAMGSQSLMVATDNDNTAVGYRSLAATTSGTANTATGSQSLAFNTGGDRNTANGYKSLVSNTGGDDNTATGYQSLADNTTGGKNTAAGAYSLNSNTTGSNNTATGYEALHDNTTAWGNTANGYRSLANNTTGAGNTAMGDSSQYANIIGNENTAMGYQSLVSNTADYNTAFGTLSMQDNTIGTANTAIGRASLLRNIDGYENVAVGYNSMASNTSGSHNTAIGVVSLDRNTTGDDNVAIGYNSLGANTGGGQNTATGVNSLLRNTTGNFNTAHGSGSLDHNTTGYHNTAVGYGSLNTNNTGYQNTAVGYGSLNTNTTGTGNTAIGYNADVSAGTLTNATAIGAGATVNASNTIKLGDNSVTNVHTAGSVAINSTGALANTSAILDLSSTTKGVLVPRMTLTERNAILSPATGLLVYQLSSPVGFYYYSPSSGGWTSLLSGVAGAAGGDLTGTYPNPTLTATGVTPGIYGSGSQIPLISVGADGRINGMNTISALGGPPSGTAGGDLTGTYPNPTLRTSGVTAGTYGSSTTVPQIAVDAKGRITSATNVAISGLPSGGTNGQVLTIVGGVPTWVSPPYFGISATSGANGSISPAGVTLVATGTSQVYNITPASGGWVISDVLVDGVSVGAVSTYTFTAVAANHTISAAFAPPAIGASFLGGKLAYVLVSGDPGYSSTTPHGLIAAPSDQSSGIHWYNGSNILTGAIDTSIGTGQANTTIIVSVQGSGSYAASICNSLTLGGYSDWYLPSKHELNKLYLNKVAIGGFASLNFYLSSSEATVTNLWGQNFGSGSQVAGNKSVLELVRAIRAF